ncbi:MAG: hypothetical protein WAL59_07745, partial [Roseiarcus sp.]
PGNPVDGTKRDHGDRIDDERQDRHPAEPDKATSAPQAMRRASRPRSIVIGVFKFAALPLHLADQRRQFLDLDVETQLAPSRARLDRNGE